MIRSIYTKRAASKKEAALLNYTIIKIDPEHPPGNPFMKDSCVSGFQNTV